jgi:hypothetical protein
MIFSSWRSKEYPGLSFQPDKDLESDLYIKQIKTSEKNKQVKF